ncbi:unnamed protein product [Closterium sp. NIES-54]
MYAMTDSAEGDCYLCVPPDPGIQVAALGASESSAPGTGESVDPGAGEALHTFTLDSGASCSFFRDSTTLMPLSRPVAVTLADPSGGPILAHSSTVLPCPAAPSGMLSGLHLPSFLRTWSSPVSAPSSCRPRTHETLLWHHRLGHPSLPRLRGMASRTLVSGLPRCLPPLPPGPAPTCVPCVEGRQRAAPHSSSFPLTKAPLQTLHMDMWGPAPVRGQGHERYFLLVVDDYSRYTSVFPLRSKGEVTEVLIDWIRGARRQLSESFGSDLPVLHLHSDRGGEFSSDLLRAFCRTEGIRQMFTLPASPQQNGIAERRIGMVMDVARTSMIHVAAPHFLWPFVVQYATHQINLQPRVSLPETTPTLRTSRLTSRCLTTVSFPTALPLSPPPPLFLALGTPPVDPLPPQGPAPSGVSQIDPAEPVEIAVDSGAARGAELVGAGTGGAEPGGVESWGAEPECVEPGGAVSGGAESGGSPGATGAGATGGAAGAGAAGAAGGAAGAAGGAAGAGATGGAAGASATGGAAGAGAAGEAAGAGAAGAAGPGGARTGGTGAAGAGGAAGVVTGDPGAEGTGAVAAVSGGATWPRSYYIPLLQQHVPLPSPPASSLSDGLDPETDSLRAASPTISRFLATAVTNPLFESTAASALVAKLVDFAAAYRVEFATSLVAESASESVCPPFVGGECALGTDVLEDRQEEFECFAAAVPHLMSMLLALEGDTDAPDIPTPRSYAEAIEGPYSSQWQAAMDAEMASWKSTGTYVEEVPPPGTNIVSGMWILRVKRPPGSPPVFKVSYVARGFSQ